MASLPLCGYRLSELPAFEWTRGIVVHADLEPAIIALHDRFVG
jgi:hypothetical protein